VGNLQVPDFVQDGLPALGGEFRVGAHAGVIAMGAIVIAAIRDREVHAVGRTQFLAKRQVHFQPEVTDWA